MKQYEYAAFLRQVAQAKNLTMQPYHHNYVEDENPPPSSSFCEIKHGHGMTMYMDGFHFTLNSFYRSNEQLSCLNIFTPYFTLSTRVRFYIAMIGVAALGVSIEAISTYKVKRFAANDRKINKLQTLLLNFSQAIIGYLLMLAVMSYSIELLLCASLGYAMGHHLFDHKKQLYLKMKNQSFNFMDNNPCHLEFGDDLGAFTFSSNQTNINDDMRRNDGITISDQETTGLLSRRSASIPLNS